MAVVSIGPSDAVAKEAANVAAALNANEISNYVRRPP
jgi:hypothetical protein